ncbi:MAG: DUF3616 domain-containing protein [Phycisphaerae bacterium]|jgi:hypothetical protein|nr:DUF3616 domain-containing protein [Phycisphaerae bacterium]MDP7286585.1 DUF3616 domain-containing protein [Phycisphaerae bacterium]
MDAYDARKRLYVIVAAMAACLLSFAISNCRKNRTDRDRSEQAAATRPASGLGDKLESIPRCLIFSCASDASGAVAIDDGALLVADDENNVLRAYRTNAGSPIFEVDLSAFLELEGDRPEVDIEAAARIGNRVYWISSHGRNRNGKWRPNRCRFFATDISSDGDRTVVRPAGRFYAKLAERIMDDPGVRAACPGLPASFHSGKLPAGAREFTAPKQRGLNIEGLCANADGDRLYIGLRNPLSAGRSIVIPLLNPSEIIDEAKSPKFGRPMLWDLDSRGIRDMVHSARHGATFILAGPKGDTGHFALYRWSGKIDRQPVFVRKLNFGKPTWRPEALVAIPNSSELLILSDDGVMLIPVNGPEDCIKPEYHRYDGTCLNKHLREEARKYFRGTTISPTR